MPGLLFTLIGLNLSNLEIFTGGLSHTAETTENLRFQDENVNLHFKRPRQQLLKSKL